MSATGFDLGMLAGPFGGMVGLAFGAGCTVGFAFCLKTMFKMVVAEREACETQLAAMDTRIQGLSSQIKELNDRMIHQMERQLGQIRQSSNDVLGRDR